MRTKYPPLMLVLAAVLVSPGLWGGIRVKEDPITVVFAAIVAFLLISALRTALRR